jgi:Tfp pilus assembly protein PilW
VLISVALGMVVMVSAASFYSYSVASFAAISNFSDMSRKDRYASDIISRDIRSATSIAIASGSDFVLNAPPAYGSNATIAYHYDAVLGTLTRVSPALTQMLLTNIVPDSLTWKMYERPAAGTGVINPTTIPAAAKFAAVQWTCWRRVSFGETNSEITATARIELRNQ